MFVLCEAVDYEGESVLGVFSSLDLAIAGAESYDRRGREDDRSEGFCSGSGDDLVIYEVTPDAPAFWGRDYVWSLAESIRRLQAQEVA